MSGEYFKKKGYREEFKMDDENIKADKRARDNGFALVKEEGVKKNE